MISIHHKLVFYLIFILSLSTLFVPASFSQQTKDTGKKTDNSSIEITSDRMRSENGGQKIIFSGNVVAAKGDMTITSDIMELYNTSDKKQIEEIVAIGHVKISSGEKKAEGDRAVYLEKLQKIILTGNPTAKAFEGNDIIEGREMIFLMKKNRFVVNERVRVKLFPKSNNKNRLESKKHDPFSKSELEKADQENIMHKTLG